MAKVKGKRTKTGLDKFNTFLLVLFIILVVATALIIIFSSAKTPVDPNTSTEFVDEPQIEEFQAGTYGGKSFETVEDVVNYYKECYDYTKTLTAEYVEAGNPSTYYKLLGQEELFVENLLVEGNSNETINKLVPSIVGNLFTGGVNGLSPSGGKSSDNDIRGDQSQATSQLQAEDVLMANVKENEDGTIDITIQPKAQILAMPNEDPQGRFFNVLGDISSTVESISVLSFSEGTIEDNFVVNYAGGTGTVTIDTSTGEIIKANYEMKVHIDVKHANVTILKDKNASLDIRYICTFPATDEYLAERDIQRK
ncbi:MAG: hypothetical protein ACI4IG_08025 [Eubacterium sp.]